MSSSAERERTISVRVDSDGTWAEARFSTSDPAATAWLCHGDTVS